MAGDGRGDGVPGPPPAAPRGPRARRWRWAAVVSVVIVLVLVGVQVGSQTGLIPRNLCAPLASFDKPSYGPGDTMVIHYRNPCFAATAVNLHWPDGTLARDWTVAAGGNGTLSYTVPTFAYPGPWDLAPSVTADVRPMDLPGGHVPARLGLVAPVVAGDGGVSPLGNPNPAPAWSSLHLAVQRVAVGDLDGDGDAEVVALGKGPGGFPTVVVADPDGQMATQAWHPPRIITVDDLAVGDFDGDGRAEIALLFRATDVPNSDGLVEVVTPSGRPLNATRYWVTIPAGLGFRRMAAGDVNGDGVADLVFGGGTPGTPGRFYFAYVGFQGRARQVLVNESRTIVDVAVTGDVARGSGRITLLDQTGQVGLYNVLQTGVELDRPWFAPIPASDGRPPVALAAGDVDGDGQDEVMALTGAGTAGSASLYIYNTTDRSLRTSAIGPGFGADVAAGDLAGKGVWALPTGESQRVSRDVEILGRVGVPPYLRGLMEAGKATMTFIDGGSTRQGDTIHTWKSSYSISDIGDEGLIVGYRELWAHRYLPWTPAGDGVCCDAGDTLWAFTTTHGDTAPVGTTVETWNRGGDFYGVYMEYPSWVHLGRGEDGWPVPGDPASYPLGAPDTFGGEPPVVPSYRPGDYAWQGVGPSGAYGPGVDISLWRTVALDPTTGDQETLYAALGMEALGAALPSGPAWDGYGPWQYYFEYVPYVFNQTLVGTGPGAVPQRFPVLQFAVRNLGIGYTGVRPVAAIATPTNGTRVTGPVEVWGTANTTYPVVNDKDNTFARYSLEWGGGGGPTDWHPIPCAVNCSFRVEGGLLGTWNPAGLAPGTYHLRLTAWDWGSHMATTTVDVIIP